MSVTLPSLRRRNIDGKWWPPRIVVLEVAAPDKPEGGTVAWVMVERVETQESGEDRLELHYQRVTAAGERLGDFAQSFAASHSRLGQQVRLSHGMTALDLHDLRGHRIGTYLMTQIVGWVKQWPDASVSSVGLLVGQAGGENRERRNRFWERYGLIFDYADPATREEGRSRPILTRELVEVDSWQKNIKEQALDDYLGVMLGQKLCADADVLRLQGVVRANREEVERRDAHPLRWALRLLAYRWRDPLILLGVLALMVAAVIWRY